MSETSLSEPNAPVLACDLTRMTVGDLAACAHFVSAGLGEVNATLWVPAGSDIARAQSVFSLYSVAVEIVRLHAPDGYRSDAPAFQIAAFSLAVAAHARQTQPSRLYAPTSDGAAYFARMAGIETGLIVTPSGLAAQLEGGTFPETPGDLVALDQEYQLARQATEITAVDALLADSYERLIARPVSALGPGSDDYAVEPDAGRLIYAPVDGLTDPDLVAAVLSKAAELGPVDIIIADTVLAEKGKADDLARAVRSGSISVTVERYADIDQALMKAKDERRCVLSLRDCRALDPLGAWAAAFGAPVIAGVGPALTDPGALPAPVRPAISHPAKLAPLIVDPAVTTRWSRPRVADAPAEERRAVALSDISIIVATHARPAMLDEALASVADQDRLPAEIIVVDDGSPTELAEQNKALCERFDACPIRYQLTDNLYPGHARNTGAALARSDWLYFLDDDNRLKPDALAQIEAAQNPTGAEAVFSFMEGFGPAAPKVVIPFLGPVGSASIFDNHAADTGIAISRSAFERIGGFPETYGVGKEDYAMAVKIARSDIAWTLIPEPLYAYRIHDNRIRKKHRTRTVKSFLPLSAVLPITDGQGRLKRHGLLERLAFIQAERLALRHVPHRKNERLSPVAVLLHHGLRPFVRSNRALRQLATSDGAMGKLVRALFFRGRG